MIEKLFLPMIDPHLMLSTMKEALRTIDPQYSAEEEAYLQGISALRDATSEDHPVSLDAMLDEQERTLGESLLFLFWRGVKQNYDCFRNPVNKLFLQMDYEDFHQESLMKNFIPKQYQDLGHKFAQSLPAEMSNLLDPITSYHSYMETTAYKLSHYYGFCFGNSLLSQIMAGFSPDIALTSLYTLSIEQDLNLRI